MQILSSVIDNSAIIWTFMCFPVSGTKLLCVTESIIFFIEYNTL